MPWRSIIRLNVIDEERDSETCIGSLGRFRGSLGVVDGCHLVVSMLASVVSC